MSLSSAIASYMRPSSIYGPADIVRWSMFGDGSGITRWSPTGARMWYLPGTSHSTNLVVRSIERRTPMGVIGGEIFISYTKARQLNPWITNEFPIVDGRECRDLNDAGQQPPLEFRATFMGYHDDDPPPNTDEEQFRDNPPPTW